MGTVLHQTGGKAVLHEMADEIQSHAFPYPVYILYRVIPGHCRFVKIAAYSREVDAQMDREWFAVQYPTDELIIVKRG